KDDVRMTKLLAGLNEYNGRGGVEFEQVVVVRDHIACVDIVGKAGRLLAIQIACDTASWIAAVDGEQRDVDMPIREQPFHPLIAHRIAAMIDRPRTDLRDVSQMPVSPVFIAFESFVGGGNGGHRSDGDRDSLAGIEAYRICRINAQPLGHERPVRFWNDEDQILIYLQ